MPLQEPLSMVAQFDKDSNYVSSIFRKATYRVQISVDITSNALFTVASLLDMGAGTILGTKELLCSGCKESIQVIKSPPLRMANRKVVNIEGPALLLVRICDLCICALCRIVGNLAVHVLSGTSFINQCVRGISKPKEKSSLGIRGQWRLLRQRRR